MTPPAPGVGSRIRQLWLTCSKLPGGTRLASWLFGRMVPYSGSISPEILELSPGVARVRMRDRRAVRNHLNSIHAVALLNLAELTSGLALVPNLPGTARGIITHLGIEYMKKARGTLVAECRVEVPTVTDKQSFVVTVEVRDAEAAVVARAEATWLLSPG